MCHDQKSMARVQEEIKSQDEDGLLMMFPLPMNALIQISRAF